MSPILIDNEIAVTGMSGQFPNSHNVKEYIDHLLNKRHLCDDEQRRGKVHHLELPKVYGNIYNVDKFDAGNFGVHCLHAIHMDPMGRLLMEQVYSALFDAGLHPEDLKSSKTGVFIGGSMAEYELNCYKTVQKDSNVIPGVTRSMHAQRISYCLQLNGPSYNCDTACSSSLYALEEGYRAIREGRCDRAIIGGSHLCLNPIITLQFARLGVLNSGTGCRPFDNDASGYTRSEAIVVIILQNHTEAKRIYGILVHAKTNEDGFKQMGITFPSSEGQYILLKEAYTEANVDPMQVGFIETHGTGTVAGDPQELSAIYKMYQPTKENPLMIGSVKGNIGHAEGCAALSSFVKVMSSLNSDQIPPNIHFDKPRQNIKELMDKKFKIITEVSPFPKNKRYAGISSFGFGGANAHAIVKIFDKPKQRYDGQITRLICYSGRTQAALDAIHENIVNCKDIEYLALIQESFKTNFETHLFRGYTLIGTKLRSSWKITDFQMDRINIIIGSFDNFQVFDFLKNIPIVKSFLSDYRKDLNGIPTETLTHVMLLHCFIELELPITIIDNKYRNIYQDLFKRHLKVNDLSKALIAQKNVGTTNSIDYVDAHKETIITLGKTNSKEYFNKFIIQKSNLIEFSSNLSEDSFICNIGKLYQLGFNPQVQKLYTTTSFPVGRGTHFLSHLVKWKHKTVPCLKPNRYVDTEHIERIDVQEKEFDYLRGHLIDGRNVFPATGYIFHVWKLLAQSMDIHSDNLNIVFGDVKFHRACTITNVPLELHIVIAKSGNFQITESGAITVTGIIRIVREDTSNLRVVCRDNPLITNKSKVTKRDGFTLTAKCAYRELRLRGYNYCDPFRAIQEITQNEATIKWDHNWTSFLDSMLQTGIFDLNTRNLYIPVGIKQLVICAKEYTESVNMNNNKFVKVNYKYDRIFSEFIQFSGVSWKSIFRRKERLQPVLEKYQFVPNELTTDLATSIRINMQLLLECKQCESIKISELVESYEKPRSVLSNHICNVAEDLPLVKPDITVVTKRDNFQVPHCKTEKHLPEENVLIICKNPSGEKLMDLSKWLLSDGFLLCLSTSNQTFLNNYIILTQHNLGAGEIRGKCIYLLRKRQDLGPERITINLSNSGLSWLKDIQCAMKTNSQVVLIAQDDNASGILGFTKCLIRERGAENVCGVYINDKYMLFDVNNNNNEEQFEKQLAKQMKINVFKNGQWGTYRHLLLPNCDKVQSHHWFAKVLKPGDLTSLSWIQGHLKPGCKPSCKILYAALNFKDLMLASGKLSIERPTKQGRFEEHVQGFEFVGIDSRNKRVCAIGNCAISNISDDVYFALDVPDDWNTEDAATILVAYSTVLVALIEKANLQRKQSVLIHSGTGGIGLAALNICTHFDCNIFVTIGTEEKRKYIINNYPNIKQTQIGNSRDASFREMVLSESHGNGVNLVLNSLAEEKLQASVDCLTFGGTFIEIGKYDMEKDTDLSLDLVMRGCTYMGVMLDSYIEEKNNRIKLKRLWDNAFRDGYVKAIPKTIFQMHELEDAYKYLSTGRHIGKVLIQIDHEIEHKVLPRYYCDPNKTYIIFGGLGGIGLELTNWLINRGAKHIVLSSRKGVTTGYQKYRLSVWKSCGVKVTILVEDMTNYDKCEKVLRELHEVYPIDGIFNLAIVLCDLLFENQTAETMNKSLQPKAILTKNVDAITRQMCPDLSTFVVFSSVFCGRGNIGQTNYGYSNSVMEMICEQRHLDGLPALAVQWGAVGDVGILESIQKDRNEMSVGGTLQQKIGNCLEVLETFLLQNRPIVSSIVIDEKFRKYTTDSSLDCVARILGIKDIKSVSPHATFPELGMDSMILVEIKQILERDFDIFITNSELRNATFTKLKELSGTDFDGASISLE